MKLLKELFDRLTRKTNTTTKITPTTMIKPKGIWALSSYLDKAIGIDALNHPSIQGVFLRCKWDSVEPLEGKYDWAFIDSEIDRVAAYNKYVSIGVSAGDNAPAWLDHYTPLLTFENSAHQGANKVRTITLHAPYENVFIEKYGNMLTALSKHLKDTGRYERVLFVKINGINMSTMETRLPAQFNALSIWKESGYTLTKLLDCWNKLASIHKFNFPDKYLSLAVIGDPVAFVSIDENGNEISDKENKSTEKIVNLALANYSDRLIAQNNCLTDTANTPLDSLIGKCLFAYQETSDSGKSDEYVLNMCKNAIAHKAEFVELFDFTIKGAPTGVTEGSKLFI